MCEVKGRNEHEVKSTLYPWLLPTRKVICLELEVGADISVTTITMSSLFPLENFILVCSNSKIRYLLQSFLNSS